MLPDPATSLSNVLLKLPFIKLFCFFHLLQLMLFWQPHYNSCNINANIPEDLRFHSYCQRLFQPQPSVWWRSRSVFSAMQRARQRSHVRQVYIVWSEKLKLQFAQSYVVIILELNLSNYFSYMFNFIVFFKRFHSFLHLLLNSFTFKMRHVHLCELKS